MVTKTASHTSHSWYKEDDVHGIAKLNDQESPIVPGRRIVKWFGALSTVLMDVAALAPSAFGIPADLQSWVFVTSIFWSLAFCAGMFDL